MAVKCTLTGHCHLTKSRKQHEGITETPCMSVGTQDALVKILAPQSQHVDVAQTDRSMIPNRSHIFRSIFAFEFQLPAMVGCPAQQGELKSHEAAGTQHPPAAGDAAALHDEYISARVAGPKHSLERARTTFLNAGNSCAAGPRQPHMCRMVEHWSSRLGGCIPQVSAPVVHRFIDMRQPCTGAAAGVDALQIFKHEDALGGTSSGEKDRVPSRDARSMMSAGGRPRSRGTASSHRACVQLVLSRMSAIGAKRDE